MLYTPYSVTILLKIKHSCDSACMYVGLSISIIPFYLRGANLILPVLHLSSLQQVQGLSDNWVKDLVTDGQLCLKALKHQEGSGLHLCPFWGVLLKLFVYRVLPCVYRAAAWGRRKSRPRPRSDCPPSSAGTTSSSHTSARSSAASAPPSGPHCTQERRRSHQCVLFNILVSCLHVLSSFAFEYGIVFAYAAQLCHAARSLWFQVWNSQHPSWKAPIGSKFSQF